ncbi:unnamed protein product [Diplocarpon coronariae]|nr:hypothetical protein JHW43_006237 [Diplocarpon mali]
MSTQVNVTLLSLNGDLEIDERSIILSHENHSVPVGRASKSATKGIVGAVDNACFADFLQDVTIKDIGSMHGTFLNGIELTKNIPMVVGRGDILVFGTEVRRGAETFPACRFRVDYKIIPNKQVLWTSSTFAFPESSDIEDEAEENCDKFSDSLIEERENQYSSEDGVSIDSPSQKSSQALDPIDLTGDDLLQGDLSNRVDLTGESELAKNRVDLAAGSLADIDENAEPTSNGIYAGNLPILVETDEGEDVDYSSDDLSEDSEVLNDQDRRHLFEDDTDLIDNSEMNTDGELVDGDDFDVNSSELPIANTRYALASDEDPVINISDVCTRTDLEKADEVNATDHGLSHAAAEGMRVFCDESSSQSSHNSDVAYENNDETQIGASSPRSSPATALELTSASNHFTESNLHINPMFHEVYHGKAVPVVRQPSPSDAAMVKPPGRVSICDLGEPSDYTSRSLGEKSGKSAFFAAREINKVKFMNEHVKPTMQAATSTMSVFSGETDVQNFVNHIETEIGQLGSWNSSVFGQSQITAPADTVMFGPSSAEKPADSVLEANEPISSLPTRDLCDLLDKPDKSSISDCTQSPLPDMKSSHTYNISSLPGQNPRSAIKIPDIIEASSPFPRANTLKRKSDDMSNVTEKELRQWAKSNVSDVTPIVASDSKASIGEKISKRISIECQAPESRPVKRFKKLLGNVGLVALGGATIFAALVATAPDFM